MLQWKEATMTDVEFIEEIKGYVSFGNLGSVMNAAKAYAKAENQRLRDMLKAIINHSNESAMDDALFRKFARSNAMDVLGIVDETRISITNQTPEGKRRYAMFDALMDCGFITTESIIDDIEGMATSADNFFEFANHLSELTDGKSTTTIATKVWNLLTE